MASVSMSFRVRLHDTDAAGLLFFARQLYFCHDVYEELLRRIGMPMEELIAKADFFVPIVHAEAQFLRAVDVGQLLNISVNVAALGISSYTLGYAIYDEHGEQVGTGKTVHVTVSRDERKKIRLPAELRSALANLRDTD